MATITIQGETLNIIDPTATGSAHRTETGRREITSAGGSTRSGPGQEFNEFGLHRGYLGAGYLDIAGEGTGAKAAFTFKGEPGVTAYLVSVRLANGSSADRPLALVVDGVETIPQSTKTGGWDAWELRTFTITVAEGGPHTVQIVQKDGAGAPNIDAVAVHATDVPPASLNFFAPASTSDTTVEVSQNEPALAEPNAAENPGPLDVTFDPSTVTAYNANQDQPEDGGAGVIVSADGRAITLSGNLWKKAPLPAPVDVTAQTRLAVDVRIDAPGEMVAVGFDDNDEPFDGDLSNFLLVGSEGNDAFADLRGTGTDLGNGFTRFVIDLSVLEGRSLSHLTLVTDDDRPKDGLGAATFANVAVFQDEPFTSENNAPEVVGEGIGDIAIGEGAAIAVDLPFTDPDGDPLTYDFSIVDADGAPVTVDGLAIDGTALAGPAPAAPGVYTVTLTASDGTLDTSTTFALTVSAANGAPEASGAVPDPIAMEAGAEITPIPLTDFAAFFTDPDGDALTLSAEGLPSGLSVEDGAIAGTPSAAGTFAVTVRATDPGGLSDTLTVNFEIADGGVGDSVLVEAEAFTGIADPDGYSVAAQGTASGGEVILLPGSGSSGVVTTDLTANGVGPGWYTLAMTFFDEPDGSSVYSLSVGDTVLADTVALDGAGTFDNPDDPRGPGGEPGNQRTVSFDAPVLVEAGTVLTLSGAVPAGEAELSRIDSFTFTRVEVPGGAPSGIALDNASVAENAAGAVVGTLSANDPEGGPLTFAVDPASPFEVVGSTLQLKAGTALDFEAGATVDVAVTVSDGTNAATETLTLTVTNVNEAPAGITLDNASVAENAEGAVVGALSATDPEGDPLTFSVDPASPFEVVDGVLQLKAGVSFDHEAGETVTVDVTVSDAGGLSTTNTLTVTVADVNEAPTISEGAALDDATFTAGVGGTVPLAALAATDEDEGDTPLYAVRATDGAALPDGVAVEDGVLVVPAGAPEGIYALEIVATDGTLVSAPIPITVTVDAPAAALPLTLQPSDDAITLSATPDGDATVTLHRDAGDPADAETPGDDKVLDEGLRAGFSGNGYVDFGDDAGDTVTFTFTVPEAGDYDLSIRYAAEDAGDGDLTLDLAVNGGTPVTTAFPSTGTNDGPAEDRGFNNWDVLTETVALQAGENTVTLALSPGASAGPNIDRVEITEAGTGPIDRSADEDGNLAATAPERVTVGDLGAVEVRLSGADADIVAFEVSTDGAVSFVPVTPVADGEEEVLTLDLSMLAELPEAVVDLRLTDEAGNTETRQITFVIEDDVLFSATLQAEDFTILDTTPGNNGSSLTEVRDPSNPEGVTPERPTGLWEGFTGTGYVDMGGNVGDAVSFIIAAPEAGTYRVAVRYANGASDARPMAVNVDGEAAGAIDFSPTPDWDEWQTAEIEVELAAGTNTIALANTGNTGPNLDSAVVTFVPVAEPGPRETIKINFQDRATPTVDGYLVDNFEGFADRGNGHAYGWVTEASATDADGTTATPINGADYPAESINERTGGEFDTYDPRLTGYAHFDLRDSYPAGEANRTAWEMALADGWYEVTVSVGDTGGPNDSSNALFMEGELATSWVPTDAYKSQLVTHVVNVTDGFLTLSAESGEVTEMQYLEIRALPDLTPHNGKAAPTDYASFSDARAIAGVGENETVVDLDLGAGARPEGVDPLSDIFLGIDVVEGRGGALLRSLNDGSVTLYETLTGNAVSVNINTTGGFDSLTISPDLPLKEFTSYTLVIDGFQDRGKNDNPNAPTREFEKFSTTFVTGQSPEVIDREVAFRDVVELNGGQDGAFGFTSLEMSADGTQLYVVTIGGQIKRWDVDALTGAIDTASEETFTPMGDFIADPNDPINGRRGFIGLAVDPEDPNVLWVTDNAPIPLSGRDNGVPDFSGRVSKVTLGEDGALESATIETYITGLPRSNGDHVTNSLEFRANPDAGQPGEPNFLLYLVQGSNSAMGDADSAWGFRPERLLNASVMEIDHTRAAPDGGFDVTTEPLPADGNNRRFEDGDNDLKNGGILMDSGEFAGNYLHFSALGVASVRDGPDPFDSALIKEFYDPYAEDAVLSIFATGQRNAYDLVWHSNGFLYVPTNGSAAGGSTPDDPATPINERTINVQKQDDYLFRMTEGGYYGHPVPLRNEYILNGGEVDNRKYPNDFVVAEPTYDADGVYSLGENRSPNGAIEYKNGIFGNSLQGGVLFTEYSGGDDVRVVLLDESGMPRDDFVLQDPNGDVITYTDPLDIIEGPGGQLYLLTLNRTNGESQIVRLDPVPGGVITDETADEGGDLALIVADSTDPAAVVFTVPGLDDDIVSLTVTVGETSQLVTLDASNQFTLDLSGVAGPADVTLEVADDEGNLAAFTTRVSPGDAVFFIDALEFTNLDIGSTVLRDIDDPATHETPSATDADGDGLNDGFDGDGYADFRGGAGDKVAFVLDVDVAGIYDFTLRLANGSFAGGSPAPRPIAVKTDGDSVTIADTYTGSFTLWQDFTVTLRLEEGENTLIIEQLLDEGGPNVDSVGVRPNTLDPVIPNDGEDTVGDTVFTVYEAENAALTGAIVLDDAKGQRGEGYVDFSGAGDQTITWTIDVDADGTYALDILYALAAGEAARPMTLAVDGNVVETLPFPPNSSAAEDVWGPQSTTLSLTEGVHVVTVTAPGANGPNVDYLRVSQQPVGAFEPTFATIDGEGRLELEAADNTTRTLENDEVEFYFTVSESGAYAFDFAANAGAPDGAGLTVLLNGVEIGDNDFPGVGEAGESTVFATLEAGVPNTLTVRSDQPGANALDYVDVRPAPGNVNADIAVQSLDPVFFADRLQFSWIDDPETNEGRAPDRDFKEAGTVRLSNTGTEPLEVLEADIDGPFALASPSSLDGLTIAPGSFVDVTVEFDRAAFAEPTGNRLQRNVQQDVIDGALTIRTNDADTPVSTVALAAFWQPIPEDGWEPNVNEVWELFGFGNAIEGLSKDRNGQNSALSTNDVFGKTDETEVLSPYWTLADGVSEATITQLAAYHGPGGAELGIHGPGDNGNANQVQFWNHQATDNQTILPNNINNNFFATRTFSRDDVPADWLGESAFGIEVAGLSTDPRLNPTGDRIIPGAQQGHTVKAYQALDGDGAAIANTYLIVMDYTGINYDYNDNLYLVEGIAPAGFGGVLSISGLDDAAADDRLVFTNIDQPDNSGGLIQAFRNEATVTLSNDGFGPLEITGLSLSGVDADDFVVTAPTVPLTLDAGESADVTITFIGSDPANDNAAELRNAALTVETFEGYNDQTIALAGLAQIQSERGEEPSVAQIVEALGYSTDVAQSDLNGRGVVETIGDEVLAPYLVAADGGDVTVISVAAFLQQGDIGRLSKHDVGDATLTELYASDDNQGQTVMPDGLVVGNGDTGSTARATFDGSSPFGLKVSVDGRPTFAAWTDPDVNLADPAFTFPGIHEGHLIRYFQGKDADGNIIPNTLIAIQDYPGGGNFDYNDHMYVIKNVVAYDPTGAEDADGNGVVDAVETDADNDGLVAFFDPDEEASGGGTGGGGGPDPEPERGDYVVGFNVGGPAVASQEGLGVALRGDTDPLIAYAGDGATRAPGSDSPLHPNGAGALSGAFQSYRDGKDWSATVSGLSDGEYVVVLHTQETVFDTAGQRIFDMAVNGTLVADDLDPFTVAGGGDIPLEIATLVTVTGGSFTVSLDALAPDGVDNAALSAITVYQSADNPGGGLAPIQTPFPGPDAPTFIDGVLTVDASNYDEGGQGVAYNDGPGRPANALDGGRADSDVEHTRPGDIGWIRDGEWLEYTIAVPEAGLFDLDIVMASVRDGRAVTVDFYRPGEDTPYASTGSIANPVTGSFGNFQPRSLSGLALEAGEQIARVTFTGSAQNFRSFSLTADDAPANPQTPWPGPDAPTLAATGTTVFDATNYDDGGQGVAWNDNPGLDGGAIFRNNQSPTDVEYDGAQNDVGYTRPGEWVEYTIDVAEAGTYALSVSARTPIEGNSIAMSLEDGPTLATFALPDTNGSRTNFFQSTFNFTPSQTIVLEEGPQTLRFTFDGDLLGNDALLEMRAFSLEKAVAEGPSAIGEAGNITVAQGAPDQWFTVTFSETLDDPSVVMGPISLNGGQPATARVRNVTDTGFEFQIDEWDNLDGTHIAETVSWLAVESGVHTVNGQTIAAGIGTASEAAGSVSFGATVTDAVVVSQVASTNDGDPVTDRINNVTDTGFDISLDDAESNDTDHAAEALHWIALEEGGSPADGLLAANTGNTVTAEGGTFGFGGTFDGDVALIADMQTEDGGDTATVRLASLSADEMSLFIEEETTRDAETTHTTEEVGYVALSTGLLFQDDFA